MQGEGEAEEAKIIKLEDRAGLLSRNHWTKIIGNNKEMIAKLNRLAILEDRKGRAVPRGSSFMLIDLWKCFKTDIEDLERQNEPGIFRLKYWANTG